MADQYETFRRYIEQRNKPSSAPEAEYSKAESVWLEAFFEYTREGRTSAHGAASKADQCLELFKARFNV